MNYSILANVLCNYMLITNYMNKNWIQFSDQA